MQLVKIPAERVKILLGKGGETKKEIEKRGRVKISVDSDGNVSITSGDPVAEWEAINVIRAIGRGFSPEIALKLFSDEYTLKIINLKEIFPKEKQRVRYKARVIGKKGKAKKTMEEISGASICVYGNTIGMIGKLEEVGLAERAIDMLLKGASHGVVFFVLQKERKKMRLV